MTELKKGQQVTINGLDVTDSLVAFDEEAGWVEVRVYPMRSAQGLVTMDRGGNRKPATAKVKGIVQVVGALGGPVEPRKEWRSGMKPPPATAPEGKGVE